MKRKRSAKNDENSKNSEKVDETLGESHFFTDKEVSQFQTSLLEWYDENKRTLPWRTIASEEPDDNIRGTSDN